MIIKKLFKNLAEEKTYADLGENDGEEYTREENPTQFQFTVSVPDEGLTSLKGVPKRLRLRFRLQL